MKEQPIQVTVVFSESFATPDAIATFVVEEGCWFGVNEAVRFGM